MSSLWADRTAEATLGGPRKTHVEMPEVAYMGFLGLPTLLLLFAGYPLTALIFTYGARRYLGRVSGYFCFSLSLVPLVREAFAFREFYSEMPMDCTGLGRQSLVFMLVMALNIAGFSLLGLWPSRWRSPTPVEAGTGLSP